MSLGFASKKGADQHVCYLLIRKYHIRARLLSEISIFYVVSADQQVGLNLTVLETP